MQIRPLIGTFVFCASVAFFAVQVHGGIWLMLLAPFLLVWVLYSAYVIWRRPNARSTQAAKVGLWVAVVGAVLLTQGHYQKAARHSADAAVDAVFRYKANHGSFPETLEAAGVKDRKDWRLAYLLKDGRPKLFYPATFTVFDTYWYDFEHKSWAYQPD